MIIKDYIIPPDICRPWVIIYTAWNGKTGNISIERIDNTSSYLPIDILYYEEFSKKNDLMKERDKLRGEYDALVVAGRQTGPKPIRQFLNSISRD